MLTNSPIPYGFYVLNVKALVGAFNQEKALVGAFFVIVQLHRFAALLLAALENILHNYREFIFPRRAEYCRQLKN